MISGVHSANDKRDCDHNDHHKNRYDIGSDESECDSCKYRIQAADGCQPYEAPDTEIHLKVFLDPLVAYRLHDQTDAESEENHHCKDFAKEPLIRHRMAFAEQIRKKMSQEKRNQLTYCHQYTDSRQKLFIHFIDQRSLTLHRAEDIKRYPGNDEQILYPVHPFAPLCVALTIHFSRLTGY